jgi:nucleoside-diphosphate-sugar epimerase
MMKVFVAGGTGAMGAHLIPQLVDEGHEVTASTRQREKQRLLFELGAEPVVMDPLDAEAVLRAVEKAAPRVVVHQLTSLKGAGNLKRFDDEFAATNRLRTEGTDHLLHAARAAGAERFIAQSFTGWPNVREGGPVKDEDDPLDPDPPKRMRRTLEAIRYVESAVAGAAEMTGIALRYGGFYGPGTSLGQGGEYPDLVRKRRFPIVGDGAGVWSFIHIGDAAAATVAAVERGESGVYNIVDDEPAPVAEWLPYLARVLGAKPPRKVPAFVGRLAIGEVGVSMMTQIRGSSNAKAKRELGWAPRHASWRQGFAEELGARPASVPAAPVGG